MLMLGACLSVNPLTGKAIDLRVEGVHNTVLGHDNCEHGSRSTDDTFVYIDHGAVRIGNFNLSGTSLKVSSRQYSFKSFKNNGVSIQTKPENP